MIRDFNNKRPLKKIKKSTFNPGSEYIKKAVEYYFSKGGIVTKIVPDFTVVEPVSDMVAVNDFLSDNGGVNQRNHTEGHFC